MNQKSVVLAETYAGWCEKAVKCHAVYEVALLDYYWKTVFSVHAPEWLHRLAVRILFMGIHVTHLNCQDGGRNFYPECECLHLFLLFCLETNLSIFYLQRDQQNW